MTSIAKSHFVKSPDIRSYLINGWENAVETALEDRVLTEQEESRLTAFRGRFSLSQDELDKDGAYTRSIQATVIREVMEGKLPKRIKVEGKLPFNLQKQEQLIWVFGGVQYYEPRTHREYVGGSIGGSVRVAKGIYIRSSSFRGHPVDKTETVHIDTGILGVTDKNIYFTGKDKSFRVPYSKIVSFKPYSDGIGIQRDAQSAKPQTFITKHGWFTYNLISYLAQKQ